jgi:hypothetical protein
VEHVDATRGGGGGGGGGGRGEEPVEATVVTTTTILDPEAGGCVGVWVCGDAGLGE